LGKVVHTVKRAGTYAAKVSHKELHKIAVHVRAVLGTLLHEYLPMETTKERRGSTKRQTNFAFLFC
jgi:hypothetical protein